MDNSFNSYNSTRKSALDVAIRARAVEKQQALMVAQLRAETEAPAGQRGRSRGLLANLLSALRIF